MFCFDEEYGNFVLHESMTFFNLKITKSYFSHTTECCHCLWSVLARQLYNPSAQLPPVVELHFCVSLCYRVFIRELLSSDAMKEYSRARVYLDENYKSQEHFTVSLRFMTQGTPRKSWNCAVLIQSASINTCPHFM